MAQVIWETAPDAHDYPAASSYLSLLVADGGLRDELVAQLQVAPVSHYKAKDLLRASQLALLTADNVHVAADLRKIRKSRPLSPVLLVRGDLIRGFPLQIADGYHRICASYFVNENTDIPCRMIDLPNAVRGITATTPAEKAAPTKKTAPAKKALPAKKAAPAKKVTKKVAKKVAKKTALAKKVAPAKNVGVAVGAPPEVAPEAGSTTAQ